jgi:hypothetical protein
VQMFGKRATYWIAIDEVHDYKAWYLAPRRGRSIIPSAP